MTPLLNQSHHVDGRQPRHHARMNAASVDIIYLDPPFNANHNDTAPNPKTQIVLASPLCAQASNPGALVLLSASHLIPRGTGGGQACPQRGNRRCAQKSAPGTQRSAP